MRRRIIKLTRTWVCLNLQLSLLTFYEFNKKLVGKLDSSFFLFFFSRWIIIIFIDFNFSIYKLYSFIAFLVLAFGARKEIKFYWDIVVAASLLDNTIGCWPLLWGIINIWRVQFRITYCFSTAYFCWVLLRLRLIYHQINLTLSIPKQISN